MPAAGSMNSLIFEVQPFIVKFQKIRPMKQAAGTAMKTQSRGFILYLLLGGYQFFCCCHRAASIGREAVSTDLVGIVLSHRRAANDHLDLSA